MPRSAAYALCAVEPRSDAVTEAITPLKPWFEIQLGEDVPDPAARLEGYRARPSDRYVAHIGGAADLRYQNNPGTAP
jgi:hypothetical protein